MRAALPSLHGVRVPQVPEAEDWGGLAERFVAATAAAIGPALTTIEHWLVHAAPLATNPEGQLAQSLRASCVAVARVPRTTFVVGPWLPRPPKKRPVRAPARRGPSVSGGGNRSSSGGGSGGSSGGGGSGGSGSSNSNRSGSGAGAAALAAAARADAGSAPPSAEAFERTRSNWGGCMHTALHTEVWRFHMSPGLSSYRGHNPPEMRALRLCPKYGAEWVLADRTCGPCPRAVASFKEACAQH